MTSRARATNCSVMNPALRDAVIADWRGLPQTRRHPDRWRTAADLLPKLNIVGEFIAAHSSPVSLREGTLYVRVLQPALHYELEQISKRTILRKLKQRFGGKIVRDIRFRVG